MEKIQRVEDFLKLIAEISKNDIEIDSNLVYSNLIISGTPKEDIAHYFDVWCNNFEKVRNISVFVAENWQYFCQFIGHGSNTTSQQKIKMYVPLDSSHIYYGVNKLFSYLSTNNIPHRSKVAKHTRFDDVVLRLDDVYSVERIRYFVSQNSYIKEGLIPPNPFAFTDGNVALAWDGNLSYNTVVSEWVSDYINQAKRDNRFNHISYTDFYAFVQRRKEEVFKYGINITDFLVSREHVRQDDDLLDYKYATEVMLLALHPHSTIKDFYTKIEQIKDVERDREERNYLEKLLIRDRSKHVEMNPIQREVLDYAYLEISKKDGPAYAMAVFKNFAEKGNYGVFTRTSGVRKLVMDNFITPQIVSKLVYEEQKNALLNASLETMKKYSPVQTASALFGVRNGEYGYFTNQNNARVNLSILVAPNEIDNLISSVLVEQGLIPGNNEENYWVYLEMIRKLSEEKTK